MKSPVNKIALALIFTGMIATGPLLAQDPQLINVPLSRPGDPMTLDMSILSANIEVIGEDREDVQFEVSVMEGTRKIITPSGTQELKTGAYSFEVEEEDNTVEFGADWRANKIHVIARVPFRADLELSTVNHGEIDVRNVTGWLVLNNVNGPITASGITGSVIAESVNEDIDISFDALLGDGAMSFSSVNGNLTLGLPDDAAVQLHIDNARGEILSDFEVEVTASKPTITRDESQGGGVEISVESIIVANLNGGGNVIKMKTLNGDIIIRKSGS